MKAAVFIMLIAGCAAAAQPSPLHDWFVGSWAFVESDRPNPCLEGNFGIYSRDGSYRFPGERGTWALDGARLTETATAIDERINARTADDIGKPFQSTIERLSDDRMLKIWPDRRVEFVRCRQTGPMREDALG